MSKISNKMKTLFCCSLVLLVSYFTYFHHYDKPSKAFYDEYYYITHAERYLHGIVFFDVNPPLGKMFIALGEKLFNPNKNINIKEPTESTLLYLDSNNAFSYAGVRFFPVLFGFFNGLLVFLIFYGLSKNHFLSLMFSSLYLFENSSIVHFRGALLDSTLIFFSFLTILYFIYLYEEKKEKTLINYFVLGCLTSLAGSTKMVGLILILLFVFLFFKELREHKHDRIINKINKFLKRSMSYLFGLCVVFFIVFYVNVILSSTILDNDIKGNDIGLMMKTKSLIGLKIPSEDYIRMVRNKEIYNPLKIFIPMRDYFNLIKASQLFLPKFGVDETKLGSRPITSLYIAYMIAVIFIATQRILFMNTYLLPLFFSFILFFLMFNYVFEKNIMKKDKILYISIFLLIAQIFYVYSYTSAVTYGKYINYLECRKTRLVGFWEDLCHR
ncbi:MAG: phospholipid carrier-dependent glycosyltransferase [Proteobacteria bacterium]|nr:phospholipid carrier-dependent glycosyltransferase [Pseudomonadota bacterium]